MNVIDLVRISFRKDIPQLGCLLFDGQPRLMTLEPPDKNNEPSISCIPEGSYHCVRFKSPKFNISTFKIQDVPGREGIIFHMGNTEVDTKGCVLLGLSISELANGVAVGGSKLAFTKFSALLKDINEFTLNIRNAYNPPIIH